MSPSREHMKSLIEEGLDLIPPHMQEGVINYLLQGYEPGSFLMAVLENDFRTAVLKADESNIRAIRNWAIFLSFLPPDCHGSSDAVREWMSERRATRA